MSPHAVLGVRADADADEIRARYRELAKICHPDAGGDAAAFVRLTQAYKALLEQSQNRSQAAVEQDRYRPEDAVQPEPSQAAAEERPHWWDEISNEHSKSRNYKEEKKRNLYVEKALPDKSFSALALATLGAAITVTLTACVKGGVPDLASFFGQFIIYSTVLFVASAFAASVGAGNDDDGFMKTYFGVLSLLSLALMAAVPLPFLKPA
jgi:hypothetical protein